jgi:hypothetical protein
MEAKLIIQMDGKKTRIVNSKVRHIISFRPSLFCDVTLCTLVFGRQAVQSVYFSLFDL